jgi:serine/threonine protein kinase
MEYCPNGNLSDLIKKYNKLDENTAMHIILQLLSALIYLHLTKHILHRDLKTKNIMFDQHYNIRLIDFGFSKQFEPENTVLHTNCGTPTYMTPEIIQDKSYNSQCDIWSSGIILYEMLMGKSLLKIQAKLKFSKKYYTKNLTILIFPVI